MMMIEALMAVLIFAVGVLGLVGINSIATNSQSDALYRSEANRLANEMVNNIWVNADRPNGSAISLTAFSHRADATSPCDPSTGTVSTNAVVTGWLSEVKSAGLRGLPGAANLGQQIVVDADNKVTVTVCWQAPSDSWARKHVVISFIS